MNLRTGTQPAPAGMIIFLLVTILSLLPLAPVRATDLVLRGDRISLHVREVRLRTILRDFADQGIVVRADPAINPLVTVSLDNRELQQGIDAIVQPYSHALVWRSDRARLSGPSSLAELQVFKTGARQAMEYLVPEQAHRPRKPAVGEHVPGEILIRIGRSPGREQPGAELEKILHRLGGVLTGRNDELGIYRIRVGRNTDIPALAARLNQSGGVTAEPNYIYHLPPALQISAASEPTAPATTETETGTAPVAVLDSGLLRNAGLEPYIYSSLDALHPGQPISDAMGHGTQMAMIASGMITPDGAQPDPDGGHVPVIAVRIFDEQGRSTSYTLLNSVNYALDSGARVISLSWETSTPSSLLEQALARASGQGAVVIAAAGNEPTGKPVYPAALEGVIGVGALDRSGKPWKNSNFGSFVDIYAPGVADFPVGSRGEAGTYVGTSISTAFVAGRAAAYLSAHPGATVADVYAYLGIADR